MTSPCRRQAAHLLRSLPLFSLTFTLWPCLTVISIFLSSFSVTQCDSVMSLFILKLLWKLVNPCPLPSSFSLFTRHILSLCSASSSLALSLPPSPSFSPSLPLSFSGGTNVDILEHAGSLTQSHKDSQAALSDAALVLLGAFVPLVTLKALLWSQVAVADQRGEEFVVPLLTSRLHTVQTARTEPDFDFERQSAVVFSSRSLTLTLCF